MTRFAWLLLVLPISCGGQPSQAEVASADAAADAAAAADAPPLDGPAAEPDLLAAPDAPAIDAAAEDLASEPDTAVDAGPEARVLARSAGRGLGLAVDDTSVYWLEQVQEQDGPRSQILRVDRAGASPASVLYRASAAVVGSATRIAADAGKVYFLKVESDSAGGRTGGLYAVSATGGAPTTLATGEPEPFALALGTAYGFYSTRSAVCRAGRAGGGAEFLLSSGPGESVAVDGATLFFSDAGARAIRAADLDGANERVLLPGVAGVTGLAAAAGRVCYVESGELILRCLPATGGAPVTIASGVAAFATDGTDVYYATASSPGTAAPLRRAPVRGGSSTVVSEDEPSVGGLALDANQIYWLRVGAAGDTSVCALPR
jgi:hypothetical protein